jgi:hypothetical protein
MKRVVSVVTIGVCCWCGWAVAADDQAPQQKATELESLRREVENAVLKYYPDATVTASRNEKTGEESIHFEYSTYPILMRYRNKDGSWQEPVMVRGPYVGGIWGDMVLQKGRYTGDIAGAEEGVTETGPDFYSHVIAPYSKELDRHMDVKVRFPGGTPPKFLEQLTGLAKRFDKYVKKPAEKQSTAE